MRLNIKAYPDSLKYLIHPFGHLLLLEFEEKGLISQGHNLFSKSGFVSSHSDDSPSKGPEINSEMRKPPKDPQEVMLVVPKVHQPLVDVVQSSLQGIGVGCDRLPFEDGMPHGQDMILLIDLGKPYLYNITEARLRGIANRLSSFRGSVIWLTPSAQISCIDPNSSTTLGMARTL